MVDSVREIDAEDLKRGGIRAVILDLDNTLVRWREEDLTHEVAAWLQQLQSAGLKLCILSNSILGKRSVRMAQRLGTLNISKARKPSRQGFRRALAALETEPAETAIVGDQMFTDILGGNRAGIYTIMVRPIHHQEFVYTRLVHRPPERFLLKLFRRQGHL
jgi:HAD superfamily phosphatase (TIGR01668 family)